MDKLEEITAKRKRAHARFVALKSEVYRGFLEMERAAYADGALPEEAKRADRGRHLGRHGLRILHAVAHRTSRSRRGDFRGSTRGRRGCHGDGRRPCHRTRPFCARNHGQSEVGASGALIRFALALNYLTVRRPMNRKDERVPHGPETRPHRNRWFMLTTKPVSSDDKQRVPRQRRIARISCALWIYVARLGQSFLATRNNADGRYRC